MGGRVTHALNSPAMTLNIPTGLLCFLTIAVSHAAPVADRLPVRVSTVGGNGMPKDIVPKGALWNFGPGALRTHHGWQYAAYWDDARQVSVARRKLPDGAWSVVSLPGYQRAESGDRGKGGAVSRGFGDGHEKVSMGISPDGVIHLMFDHHLSTLRYRTSKLPVAADPAAHTWGAELFGPLRNHLGGPKIEYVTYPSFHSDGKSFLLYLRLGGGSGSANSHLFSYQNGRWLVNTEAASKFIDKKWKGGDKTVNAYPNGLVFQNGRLHMTWCWRDTPVANTCHDLCYAYSDDRGRTWRNNEGQVIGKTGLRFINPESPGVSVWPIPKGGKYQNGGSMTVDPKGRVHVLVRGEDGRPAHFHRDPVTHKWTRKKAAETGVIVAGSMGGLYIISPDGVRRGSTDDLRAVTSVATVKKQWFQDCKMGVDHARMAGDGILSVIGQQGKTIRVADYPLEAASPR